MKCKYCQNPCSLSSRETVTDIVSWEEYHCRDCWSYFVFNYQGNYEEDVFYVDGDRGEYGKYCVIFNIKNEKTFLIQKFINGDYNTILELDYFPDITPQNFHSKIQTILTFL